MNFFILRCEGWDQDSDFVEEYGPFLPKCNDALIGCNAATSECPSISRPIVIDGDKLVVGYGIAPCYMSTKPQHVEGTRSVSVCMCVAASAGSITGICEFVRKVYTLALIGK